MNNDKPLSDRQLKKFKAFMDAMDNGSVSVEEFTQAFELILGVFRELKVSLESELAKGQTDISQTCTSMYSEMEEMESRILKMTDRKEASLTDCMSKMAMEMMDKLESVRSMIPSMPDLSVYERKLSEIEAKIPVIKDTILDTPEEIRDKLELLKDDERVDKSAVKGIEEIEKDIEQLKKQKGSTVYVGGGSSGGGRIVKAYDLSSSLNGVLKTFTLPAFWTIIDIRSGSDPYVFRPIVDYTSNASAMSITFTDQINAATTLATGQTLLVIYAE